ncbi:pre-mRNA splicing factor [Syncephalis plumigaleata]|nr:pre-mRNA splicing factor [Syncephalis plumigaleata]
MDAFTSLLQSEIKSKKRQLDEVATATKSKNGGKKYVRRADLERQREEAYWQEQALEQQARQTEDVQVNVEELRNLSNEEVTRRLRKKDEPIRLFGETEKQRRIRLRALEVIEERSEGQRNDFMKQLEKVDEMMDHSVHKHKEENTSGGSRWLQADVVDQINENVISPETLKTDPDKVCSAIYIWTKRMLYEWEAELESRPPEVKRSNQGKHQTVTQRQSKEYLKPYFKQLKHKSMEPDVLARITEIVHYCLKRDYLQANDSYLRLSIGNAPWPIGKQDDIHERSAREKIFASQVAHVLNDETQRKWIQCIKRLMTFSQTKYPPKDLARAIG